jgi:hypothetical protein
LTGCGHLSEAATEETAVATIEVVATVKTVATMAETAEADGKGGGSGRYSDGGIAEGTLVRK